MKMTVDNEVPRYPLRACVSRHETRMEKWKTITGKKEVEGKIGYSPEPCGEFRWYGILAYVVVLRGV